MICLLLMMILISGIDNTEQKNTHSETILKQEELYDRTKAWLLMVESGKVDEEQLRKITPKSVFIAPLLAGRTGKCKEGYRPDHLGQCVKVIKVEKVDPYGQLEALLKRLSAMYAESKKEEDERVPLMSNGPLHFSLPISNSDTTPKDEAGNSTTKDVPEMIPVPMPMRSPDHANETVEDESSGFGAVNKSETLEGSGFEGSGFGSGDAKMEDMTSSIGLISDEFEYTETTEMSTTMFPTVVTEMTTEVTTEISSQSDVKDMFEVRNSTEIERKETQSDAIRFPSEEVRTPSEEFVRFPVEEALPEVVDAGFDRHTTSTNANFAPSTVYRPQFWWLPENWKIDEAQHRPTQVKFWSRIPLIHDTSFLQDSTELYRRPFTPSQPHGDIFRPSPRVPSDYTVGLNPPLPTRRQKYQRNGRVFTDRISPRSSFEIGR